MTKQELQVKVFWLEKELKFKEKEIELVQEKIRLEEKEKMRATIEARIRADVLAEQLQARMDEHPYKQLEAILKALVVKFPTLNIKDLSISTKGK